MFRTSAVFLGVGFSLCSFGQHSDFIHVDQFGYQTNATKVAVISNPMEGYNGDLSFSPSDSLVVVNSFTDEVVFTGEVVLWNGGLVHDQSGDQGWWFDFSEVSDLGTYYITDLSSDERSADFEITTNPYEVVMKQAGRMFFYNRCNDEKALPYADENWTDGMNFLNPLQDANCRYVYDAGNESLEKDLSGGWFDAGDNNKYVSFACGTLNDLLAAYEANPTAFSDSWNIPESGNGIPDLLDEVKWELDWLFKMSNPDGSVHNKMGNTSYEDNAEELPSLNMDQRFYGPTCSSSSAAVALVFSRAALVYEEFAEFADFSNQLRERAIATFDYVSPLVISDEYDTDCDDGTILSGDADVEAAEQFSWIVAASVYLFELTGEEEYDLFFQEHFADTDPITSDFWDYYDLELQDALLRYTSLEASDSETNEMILESANDVATNNYQGFYGLSENDLYRAFMPDWSYHWGSTLPKAAVGSHNLMFAAYGMGDSLSEIAKAAEVIHYFHGVNPLDLVMLSNMYEFGGDHCVNQIYHFWFDDGTIYDHALESERGPAPGYLTGGPNQYYEDPDLSPPYGQPLQKSYLDFNDNWPFVSYSISEPAIYYQASYIRLLSYYVSASETVSIHEIEEKENRLRLYPNPGKNELFVQADGSIQAVNIFDQQGKIVINMEEWDMNESINTQHLPNGVYYVEVKTDQEVITAKWVKN